MLRNWIARLWHETLWALYQWECRLQWAQGRAVLSYGLWRQMQGVPIRYPTEREIDF